MRRQLGTALVTLLLVVVVLVFGRTASADLIASTLLIAVGAMAVNLISGLAGQISLGHAALMGVGAYSAGVLNSRAGLGFLPNIIITIVVAIMAGLVFGAPSLRVKGQYLALVTVAGGFVFTRLISEAKFAGAESGLIDVGPIVIFGQSLTTTGHLVAAGMLFVIVLFIVTAITASPIGTAIAAIRDSERGAEAAGVDVYRMKLAAFVGSAVIAALAGALFAYKDGFVAPEEFGFDLSLVLLMSCIIGGLGRPIGGAVGALLLAGPFVFFPEAQRYQLLLVGPLALVTLVRLPGGVAGYVRDRRGVFGVAASRSPASKPAEVDQRRARASSEGPILSARGVTKSFGAVVAVNAVSIEVMSSSIHAVIGPNGSGKTTLIDCITGASKPDAGEVVFQGKAFSGRPHRLARAGLSRTFQDTVVFENLNVFEDAALGLRKPDDRSAGKVWWALQQVGLDADPLGPAGGLSYGQAKRLELARALVSDPNLLVLDEPSAGKSRGEIQELGDLLRGLRENGLSILLVDHHIDLVMGVADVVTVLDHGEVVAHGTPAEIRDNDRVVEAYMGRASRS